MTSPLWFLFREGVQRIKLVTVPLGLLVISDQPFVVLVWGRGSENQACHSAPGLIGDK